jgi:hypothetical protein
MATEKKHQVGTQMRSSGGVLVVLVFFIPKLPRACVRRFVSEITKTTKRALNCAFIKPSRVTEGSWQ